MRRREFFGVLGGSVAAWPLAARGQQSDRMRYVGVLAGLASSAADPVAVESHRPFNDEMQKAGWIEGNNIHFDYRFGGGDLAKVSSSAAELVALSPDLIYTQRLPTTRAVHQKKSMGPFARSAKCPGARDNRGFLR